jgi:hypothetical protein
MIIGWEVPAGHSRNFRNKVALANDNNHPQRSSCDGNLDY